MNTIIHTDIIVSLGGACRPAGHLRRKELRFFSAPLDWMCEYSLETALHLFNTKFETFFEKKEIIEEQSSDKYYYIKDTANNVVSIHHFPYGKDIDKFYKLQFHKPMLRRFKFLNFVIKKCNHITFICNRLDSHEVICKALEEFANLYPHCNILLVNIRAVTSTEIEEYIVKRLSEKLTFIEYTFDDIHRFPKETSDYSNAWLGNVEKWEEVLNCVYLSRKTYAFCVVYNVWANRGEIFRRHTKKLLKSLGIWDSLYKYRKYFP